MKPALVVSAIFLLCLPTGYVRAETPQEALREALALEQQGQMEQAIAGCEAIVVHGEPPYWVSTALYHKARLCLAAGRIDETRAVTIEFLQRFPEYSRAAAIQVIRAQVDGLPTVGAEGFVQDEAAASPIYEAGLRAYRDGNIEESARRMAEVTSRFPDTPASLRALDNLGHLLIKLGHVQEAQGPFLRVLDRVGLSSPGSRVAQRARVRLGAIYRKMGQPESARTLFAALEGDPANPVLAAEASLQLIGMAYEAQRIDTWLERPSDAARWFEVESRCQRLMNAESAPPIYRCKAELLLLESYAWRNQCENVYRAANALFEKYKGKAEFNREVATASTFVAEMLFYQKHPAEAIPHWEFVLSLCPRGVDYWPGEQVLDRAIYQLQAAKHATGASPEEVRALADELAARFPHSVFVSGAYMRAAELERYHAHRPKKK